MKIAYVVHDVNDAAVARRLRMLRAAGAVPTLIGFRRRDEPTDTVDGTPVIDLGRTRDAKMAQRALAVAKNLALPQRILAAAQGADVIIGRNLEALALAARMRRAVPRASLIYECLDIHRLLLGTSAAAKMVQRVEGALLKQVDLVLTSSPAFERDYFSRRSMLSAPVMLLENKLLMLDQHRPVANPAPPAPPWTIGWFGMLRCSRTFNVLAGLVDRSAGRICVEIAGRPSPAEFGDFDAMVARVPGFTYRGSYQPKDLPALYARCHFAWAIDYFEEGLNSKWLLPNRLYEATSFGVVPIALNSVETGRWLDQRSAGITIDTADDLDAILGALDTDRYATYRAAVTRIPKADLVCDLRDCEALITAFRRLRR